MDYGLDLSIPFTGDPDPTLPWADDDDALLYPGSLGLIDFTHSSAPLIGVPAIGADIPNIAWKRLKDVLGSGDASSLAFTLDGQADAAGQMVTERSGKGGLHIILSQTNAQANQAKAVIGKAALLAYLVANPDHAYYYSRWDRLTRASTDANNPAEMLIGSIGNTADQIMMITPNGSAASVPLPSGPRLGFDATNGASFQTVLGNRFVSIGASAHRGNTTSWRANMSLHGTYLPWPQSSFANKAGSRILYRAYLEDLTVSGRTYQQVRDLDSALWQAAFAAGGRYYGDTFTNPSTLP